MNEECVVGVYDSPGQAELAVRALKRADFAADKISVVAPGQDVRPALKAELQMGDDSVRDAAVGAGLGGILGVLAGFGLAAIPLGGAIVFLVGPLGIAAMGTVVGGLVGSMIGWGVHNEHAEHYEKLIQAGKVLLIVNGDPLKTAHAERILRETDAIEVNLNAKTASDAPEVAN